MPQDRDDITHAAPSLEDSTPDLGGRAARSAPSPDGVPEIGQTIAGKYEIERVLGAGGMGIVLAALHKQLDERVAIKVLLPGALRDAEAIGRFVREAHTQVKIKSEHVVRVTDIGTLDVGSPYIVMEYLEGRDLGQVVKQDGPLAAPDAIDFVLQACVAVAEAHALGIVHRDLKPSNLFLTQRSDGTPLVKVLDFGISKALQAQASEARPVDLTDTQAVFGSPAYMSPEQLRSSKNVDYRTDVWSMGVVLFELLTGRMPFSADTTSGLLVAIAADPPAKLGDHRPDLPRELGETIARCLAKSAAERYATVAELATALAPFAAADSRVHVDRIQRLATGSARGARHSLVPAARASTPGLVDAYALTDKPWTSRVTGPTTDTGGARRSHLALVMGIGIATVLAVGASGLVLRFKEREVPAAARAPVAETAPEPPGATTRSLGPAPSLLHAATPVAAQAPSGAPSAAAASSGSAGVLRRAGTSSRAPADAETARAPKPPAPEPPQAAATATPNAPGAHAVAPDPTSESH